RGRRVRGFRRAWSLDALQGAVRAAPELDGPGALLARLRRGGGARKALHVGGEVIPDLAEQGADRGQAGAKDFGRQSLVQRAERGAEQVQLGVGESAETRAALLDLQEPVERD